MTKQTYYGNWLAEITLLNITKDKILVPIRSYYKQYGTNIYFLCALKDIKNDGNILRPADGTKTVFDFNETEAQKYIDDPSKLIKENVYLINVNFETNDPYNGNWYSENVMNINPYTGYGIYLTQYPKVPLEVIIQSIGRNFHCGAICVTLGYQNGSQTRASEICTVTDMVNNTNVTYEFPYNLSKFRLHHEFI